MNLVTTGNAAISISTCIVGLLLLAPRTNIAAAVRFTVSMIRRPDSNQPIVAPSADQAEVEVEPGFEPIRELVDA